MSSCHWKAKTGLHSMMGRPVHLFPLVLASDCPVPLFAVSSPSPILSRRGRQDPVFGLRVFG